MFNFNDETGTLWIANNTSSPFSPMNLKIAQKLLPSDDLVAKSEQILGGRIVGETALYIRGWDKETKGVVFLLDDQPLGNILAGTCKIRSRTNK